MSTYRRPSRLRIHRTTAKILPASGCTARVTVTVSEGSRWVPEAVWGGRRHTRAGLRSRRPHPASRRRGATTSLAFVAVLRRALEPLVATAPRRAHTAGGRDREQAAASPRRSARATWREGRRAGAAQTMGMDAGPCVRGGPRKLSPVLGADALGRGRNDPGRHHALALRARTRAASAAASTREPSVPEQLVLGSGR